MPTHLYFAPAAEGKTEYAVRLVRETAVSLTADVRVCLPTSLQVHAFRKRLAAAGGAIGVRVSTFDELVSFCLDSAGAAYTLLSEPVQYRLLRAMVDRLPLTHFAPLKNKPGFIQLLQQMITELKFAQIEPARFLKAADMLGGERRLTELGVIYQHYQEQLQAQGWADRVGLYWLAAKTLSDGNLQTGRDWSLFIVDGFDDFTPIQLTLLNLIAGRAAETVILVTQSETADYPRFEETRMEIEQQLGVLGQPLPVKGGNGRHAVLVDLGSRLFTQTTELLADGPAVVELVQASDRTAEVRAALRWLKARIGENGVRPNEAALLARNTEPYQPFIRQAAAEFGLWVRFIDGQPMAQSPLIAALLNLLRLTLPSPPDNEPELGRRAVVSAWRSPYFTLNFIEPGDPEALDNIGRHQRVIRGLAQWQGAFEAQIGTTESRTAERESDEEAPITRLPTGSAADALKEKFNRFLSLIRPPAEAETMRDFVAWLERLIGPDPEMDFGRQKAGGGSLRITVRARENKETEAADIAALQTLKDILRGFVWAEEALGVSKKVDYAYFFNELSGAINSAYYHLPAHKERAEILVADAARVRGLPLRAVAILGLSEGEFPAVIGEDVFLRDADRAALREEFGFDLKPSIRSAEREFFYEAVARPSERLLLTRPTLADNGAEWPPSPFWEAVERLTGAPGGKTVSSESLIGLESAASPAEYWESLAEAAFPVEQVLEGGTWRRIVRAADILRSREQGAENSDNGHLSQLAGPLGVEYGPDHTWSASRLETYQKCAYFFFIQNVLYLQARPEPAEGLDVTQLGSVYHHIFEAVYQGGLPEVLDEETVREWVTSAAAPILDDSPKNEGFRETPWWSQTRQEIIEQVAASVTALEGEDFVFFQSEAAFGFEERPALEIDTPVGRLRLRGFIDRIDRDGNGNMRIIDYKLGGPGQFSKQAFNEGKKLQLPLYALAAQETLGLGPVIEGFYWHFRSGQKSYFTLRKADGGAEGAIETAVHYAAQAVEQIRNGRFIPKAPDGGCPAYCPAAAFCWNYSPTAW